jgi:hypothetical protein
VLSDGRDDASCMVSAAIGDRVVSEPPFKSRECSTLSEVGFEDGC